nr:hypothetical transcript [Hymenolepis microstoma]
MESSRAKIAELHETDAWLPFETARQCLLENNESGSNLTVEQVDLSHVTAANNQVVCFQFTNEMDGSIGILVSNGTI